MRRSAKTADYALAITGLMECRITPTGVLAPAKAVALDGSVPELAKPESGSGRVERDSHGAPTPGSRIG